MRNDKRDPEKIKRCIGIKADEEINDFEEVKGCGEVKFREKMKNSKKNGVCEEINDEIVDCEESQDREEAKFYENIPKIMG